MLWLYEHFLKTQFTLPGSVLLPVPRRDNFLGKSTLISAAFTYHGVSPDAENASSKRVVKS